MAVVSTISFARPIERWHVDLYGFGVFSSFRAKKWFSCWLLSKSDHLVPVDVSRSIWRSLPTLDQKRIYTTDRTRRVCFFFLLVYWNFTFFVLTASRADNLRRLKSHQPASLWPKSVWNAASSSDIKEQMEYFVAFKVLALCSQWGKFWKFKTTVAADCWLPVGRQSVIELGYLVHQRALASFLLFL